MATLGEHQGSGAREARQREGQQWTGSSATQKPSELELKQRERVKTGDWG
jgi:hypothetical protein